MRDRSYHRHPTRRTVLATGVSIGTTALAGCTGGPESADPDAVALTAGQACDVCGMVVEKHPGPNGEIFYEGERPEDHDNPARFDSLKQCLFPYRLEHERLGWETAAVYVTDYSSVDYTVSGEGGTPIISSHPEAGAFAPAEGLHYVVDSDVEGAMGPDFVPFSDREDADSFADEHEGDRLAYGEIDEAVVGT